RRGGSSPVSWVAHRGVPSHMRLGGPAATSGRRAMDERIKFFVGLDAHKDSTSIGACAAGREPARFVGTVGPDVRGLFKVLAKAGDPAQVSVVYEAGPTGFGLYRELCRRGYQCAVVAPSLIPRRPGERVKNDRRDCLRLAELSRAGELKSIWV